MESLSCICGILEHRKTIDDTMDRRPLVGPCCPCNAVTSTAVGYDQLSSTLSSLQISYGLPSASLKLQPISCWKRISDKKSSKNDKTGHGMEKREKTKSNRS
ncbi:hypothetical protein Tco_1540065 [Tanacetum coccineum]